MRPSALTTSDRTPPGARLLRRPGGWLALLVAASLGLWSALALAEPAPADATPAVSSKAPPSGTADLKAMERQIQEVLRRVSPSVVAVSGGSGVVVSKDGYVLTVAHLGQRAGRTVWITFPDGRRVKGRTLGNDSGVDAGLVKITEEGEWPHVEMGNSADVEAGQWCLALGFPVSFEHGKAPVLRIGRVLRMSSRTIITDCTIMGGDSGGPLFDLEGNLIGISSRCDGSVIGNVHVPIDCYHQSWTRLAQGEDFNSRRNNVAFLGIFPDQDAQNARIGGVFPDTAAEKAGMQAGDVILSFDGTALGQYSDLSPLLEGKKPGDTVKIEVRRGEQTLKLEATLGKNNG